METARVRIDLPSDGGGRSYEVLIRNGLLDELGKEAFPLLGHGSLFIVTDSKVSAIYGKRLLERLKRTNRRVRMVSFPAGERNKNTRTAWMIASRLSKLGADRESTILALGGGVVGDLAGFVASVYKRGIGYVQIPTTLLAQVDSSIGGKTGVDTPWGKNQIGTFYQPAGVLTDPETLRTLPPSEMMNGMAEILKCAIISDRELFDQLSDPRGFDSTITTDLVIRACRIKAGVVSKDEKENNYRSILNFGHTVGHALETAWKYRRGHGTCVILGMIAESRIANQMGILESAEFEKQASLIIRFSRIPVESIPRMDKRVLFELARSDKKSTSSSVRMSLPSEIGKMHTTDQGSYRIPVSRIAFEDSIDYLRAVVDQN